jgi:hypothetical protein
MDKNTIIMMKILTDMDILLDEQTTYQNIKDQLFMN